MQGLLLAGRYRLVDSIGSGGMGRVWRAHDEVLHRTVAVKELTAALYAAEGDRARLLARTHAEARAAARINHSAVVTIHDVLDHDNRPWIVMELVEGNSLADEVKDRGRIEPAEAARIGLWVLRGLRAAHAAGVLHRDVKPGNVLLSPDRRVLLTDFGIAQVEGDTTITRTGEIVGSVDYLAPERVRGHDPGPSSDLWALGATLYTAVEGRSPFRRTSPLTTMQAVVDEDPEPPRNAGALEPVIAALLSKEPEARPGPAEAEEMLAEAAEGRRPRTAQAHVPTARHTDTRVDPNAVRGNAPGGNGTHGGGTHGGPSYGGGPYGPSTGGAGPAGTAYQPLPAPGGPVPGKRRRGRTVALVLVLAAVVGGGGAVVMRYADGWRHDTSSVSTGGSKGTGTGDKPTPTPSDSASKAPADSLPKGWVRVKDPLGFRLALPGKDWERTVNGSQIDYSPDGGQHFVRIAIDESPDFDDPYRHQLDLQQQLKKLKNYTSDGPGANTFRDCRGSLWDFTWTAEEGKTDFPGLRRAIEETYISRKGVEYAIYMSSPLEDWIVTRQQFGAVLRSWAEAG
ncbi:serine/threonine protein kinase [Streptomyces sp. NBC_01558]|uniref:serine/threonine-protein kinase n=1 Tax=Streptomyces sp. NBC_01558 TaxID=2975878 RepID=UPI002DDABCB9|nr:serine/threonine-protein kinase [Streptomyces sp. NBC_01558]WSD81843.1 serine/threonine protein kinase [Streptomyces sp. NBC_01558]